MTAREREPDFLGRLVPWAEKHGLVRAILLTSTRASAISPVDLLSDYHVILYVSDTDPSISTRPPKASPPRRGHCGVADSADHGHVPMAGFGDQNSFVLAMLRAWLIEVVRSAISRALAQVSTMPST